MASRAATVANEDLDVAPPTSRETATRLIAKLDNMAPAFEAEIEDNERIGRLNARTLDLLRESEVPLLLLSRRFGGHAMAMSDALRVVDRLVQIDASIGWIGGNWSATGMMLAYLPDDEVRAVLADDPMPYFGASSTPTGRAVPTEGGYRVTGNWQYGSGNLHAAYVMATAITCDADGTPLTNLDGSPVIAAFMTPRRNMKDKGNWDVLGLRGTGSVDFAFVDEFVPTKHGPLALFGPPVNRDPHLAGGLINTLTYLHTSFALGVARRLLDEIAAHASKPAPRGPSAAEFVPFRINYARQDAAVRSARAFVYETWATVDEALRDGRPFDRHLETLMRAAMVHMHGVVRDVAQFVFARGGGTSLRAGRLQRWVRDALAGCQHFICNEDRYAHIGWELIGAPDELRWGPFELMAPPQH